MYRVAINSKKNMAIPLLYKHEIISAPARVCFIVATCLLCAVTGCGPKKAPSLQEAILQKLDSLDAKTTLYARHLTSGREIAIRADEPVNTLSIIKIPVMILAYRDAEASKLDLDARYLLWPQDMRNGSGLLQTFDPGMSVTYRDLITQMIITSDNTSTDILIATVGLDRVNQMLKDLGYQKTRLQHTTGDLFRAVWERVDTANRHLSHRDVFERGFPEGKDAEELNLAFDGDPSEWLGVTTAREMSRLLEQIYNGEVASRQHCDEMLAILGKQFSDSRLPRFIMGRAAVAHKTGDWPPISGNDAGIITGNAGPIAISVFGTQNRGSFYALEVAEGKIAEMLLDEWQ